MERKNRDEFRRLMEEHIAAGILTAKTHWRDYCAQVFWDFIEICLFLHLRVSIAFVSFRLKIQHLT